MHLTALQLPRLVVKYLHILDVGSSKLDEILMCRILAHVVVSVFFALELYHKTVRKSTLPVVISVDVRSRCNSHTAWPSGLLFLPPENDLMYGF